MPVTDPASQPQWSTTTLPGGHLHTPALDFGPGNADPGTGTVTDEGFVRNRLEVVAQTRAVVHAAVTTPPG